MMVAILLKLTACSIQQKCIGERLARNETVLQTVGVTSHFTQGIRMLLSEKKLTLPKISILCGGPDWPTSVLAGILKVPLLPNLLGTLPCFLLSSSPVIAGAMMSRK